MCELKVWYRVVFKLRDDVVRSCGRVKQLGSWLSHRRTDDGWKHTGRGASRRRELRLSSGHPDGPRARWRHRRRSRMPAAGPDAWRVSRSHHRLILHHSVAEGTTRLLYVTVSINFVAHEPWTIQQERQLSQTNRAFADEIDCGVNY